MDKQKLLVALVFTVFIVSLVRFNIPTVKATEITFISDITDDGYISKSGANYNATHNATSGTLHPTGSYMSCGQRLVVSYYVYRSFVFFNTSSIPDDVVVINATLRLIGSGGALGSDFNITIQNGQPTYPHLPMLSGDYAFGNYSGNGGGITIANWNDGGPTGGDPNDIVFTSLGLSWVNKTGITKLCLRSSEDIDTVTPTGSKYVNFFAAEDILGLRPRLIIEYGYGYTFHGLFDETSGQYKSASERACNVTAYYSGGVQTETFEVNGTYTFNASEIPLYFHFDLGSNGREYWLSGDEDYNMDIYIFNASLTTYTVSFLDLAGVLDDNPFVEAQRLINGTLMTVEQRRVDLENKIQMSLIQGCKYNLIIQDGSSYTFGDLLMTSTTTVQLTLKGIAFPKETLLTYKYVRIYGTRVFDTPNGTITITYQDLLNMTASVKIYIKYKNGTTVYSATETTNSFNHEWANALNNTDYRVVCTIDHGRYGVYSWKQYFPQHLSSMPWGLDWLGKSLPFNTAYIIPAFLIFFVGGCFSAINAEVGAFLMVITAIIIAYMGWLPIPVNLLVVAFTFAVIMGIIYMKRKVQT